MNNLEERAENKESSVYIDPDFTVENIKKQLRPKGPTENNGWWSWAAPFKIQETDVFKQHRSSIALSIGGTNSKCIIGKVDKDGRVKVQEETLSKKKLHREYLEDTNLKPEYLWNELLPEEFLHQVKGLGRSQEKVRIALTLGYPLNGTDTIADNPKIKCSWLMPSLNGDEGQMTTIRESLQSYIREHLKHHCPLLEIVIAPNDVVSTHLAYKHLFQQYENLGFALGSSINGTGFNAFTYDGDHGVNIECGQLEVASEKENSVPVEHLVAGKNVKKYFMLLLKENSIISQQEKDILEEVDERAFPLLIEKWAERIYTDQDEHFSRESLSELYLLSEKYAERMMDYAAKVLQGIADIRGKKMAFFVDGSLWRKSKLLREGVNERLRKETHLVTPPEELSDYFRKGVDASLVGAFHL